jgi:hypothetical protein
MIRKLTGRLSTRSRQIAAALLAGGVAAASGVHAGPLASIILVPPIELPEPARRSGDAMLLHETPDGRTLLYIEQDAGSRLATLDVTDPGHIKSEGTVQLAAPGPFDFVAPLGKQTELIRLRQGHEDAVLDLHREKVPNLKLVPGLSLQGPIERLGDEGFMVTSEVSESEPTRDYQVVATADAADESRVLDVKQVRDEVTNAGTGTTFLLTDNGLYLIRRPAVESDKRRREQEWFWEHAGN